MYLKIVKMELSDQLEYRANFISSFLFSILPFGVNVLLWLAAAHENRHMRLNTAAVVSYYFLTLIVSHITVSSSALRISEDIRLGALNQHLIKPYCYVLYQLARDFPRRLVFIMMNALPILFFFVLLRRYVHFTLAAGGMVLVPLLLCAYLINFFADFLLGACSFYFSCVSSLYATIRVLRNISAGVVFPLVMLPDQMLRILRFLPFSYTSDIPVMLLVEGVPAYAAAGYLLRAAAWAALLAAGGAAVWKSGVRRYAAFGG